MCRVADASLSAQYSDSTAQRHCMVYACIRHHDDLGMQEAAMLAAPFAAISLESIGNIQQGFQNFKDRIYYGETLPPVGSLSLSYASFLELLAQRIIKRIIIMSDGKIAMVEVPQLTLFADDVQTVPYCMHASSEHHKLHHKLYRQWKKG